MDIKSAETRIASNQRNDHAINGGRALGGGQHDTRAQEGFMSETSLNTRPFLEELRKPLERTKHNWAFLNTEHA